MPAATEYRASSGSPAGAALRNVTASESTSSPTSSTPPNSISLMFPVVGAGMEYCPMSSAPARSIAPKCSTASGPGTMPPSAWPRANTSVSISSAVTACAATVSGRASGTRRVSAPTPLWTASSRAA